MSNKPTNAELERLDDPIRLLYPRPVKSDAYIMDKIAHLPSQENAKVLVMALATLVADEQFIGRTDEQILERLKHIFGEDK